MEKVAVISDTHGNREMMDRVISFIREVHDADMMFHLGDSYKDGLYMQQRLDIECRIVPGIYCDEYGDPEIPSICEQEVCGKNILLVHDICDCKDPSCFDIVFCGHTHIADLEKREGARIINPGHLKEHVSKGRAYSYGILKKEGSEAEIIFEWYHPYEKPVLCRRETVG